MSEDEGNTADGEHPCLATLADALLEKIREDGRFEKYLVKEDQAAIQDSVRNLLSKFLDTSTWPVEVPSTVLEVVQDSFRDFATVLLEAIRTKSALAGSDADGTAVLVAGFDAMHATDLKEDIRHTRFYDEMQEAAMAWLNEEMEGEQAAEEGEQAAEEEAAAEDEQAVAEEETAEAQKAVEASKSKDTAGNDINVNVFDELRLDPGTVQAANDAWRIFISSADSREAAGEAIYAALFEGAPSLQSLFVTPRAVQAMRFMNGLASFVQAMNDPPKLKVLVETLGFGHLHLEVTVPRCVIFRDAILDLFVVELAERFTSSARDGWRKLLNYVGGAIIYVKTNYAVRVTTLLKSWKQANHGDEDDGLDGGMTSNEEEAERKKKEAEANAKAANANGKRKWGSMFGKRSDASVGAGKEGEGATVHTTQGKGNSTMSAQNVPTTYPEMFLFNAAVMGFGQSSWMSEVLACFDNIVTNVANSARLQEECDVLALRIAKVVKGNVNLAEYKSCMLASLRSLLPKDWDSAHEVAWTWLWENVERLVLKIHGQPPVWERALGKLLGSLDEDQKYEIRKDIYNAFFVAAPAGQDFFKQSNTYLHVIADKIMYMTLELYQNPVKMVDDISALGLRHVGYAVPTELFGAFVTACVEVLMTRTQDENTIEGFRWSLGLVSKMLVRTITEGSTIVMKAINANSQKLLKKAIGCAPRGQRADWMLTVQVGTQSISPFAWAVESGNFMAALAIIHDLLTFRADRDRYYYGVDALFKRHPDVISMLCEQAPDLLPSLFDGLIWRSRTADGGLRRVNYYVKHLVIDEESKFSNALKWVANLKDPKIVCHPVVVLVSDLIWSRVAYISFLYGKSWLFLNLLIFITSQSILEHLNEGENGPVERYVIFACRGFIYLFGMTQLLYQHVKDSWKSYRTKDTSRLACIRIPSYLTQWQEAVSLFLTISLVVMLCLEPIIWCWPYQDGKLFREDCPERSNMRFPYTMFSMFAMFLYYTLLVDLAVISTRVSSFVLVCLRMLPEVGLFLMALAAFVLAFSCAISVLKHDIADFGGMAPGAYALFRMFLGTFDSAKYKECEEAPTVLAVVCVFLLSTVVFLLNMLIAQLSCAYSVVYDDMVGYARLDRAETIVELVPNVTKKRWSKFVDSLHLNRRLEFNAGDVGVAGGIQSTEPSSLYPTTIDMIRRFGGSTSPEIQWPEDDQGGDDGEDRFERMEKLIQKTLQRITKTQGHKGGSSQGMSGSRGKSGSGASGDDDDFADHDDADDD